MKDLLHMPLAECTPGIPPMSQNEIDALMAQLPGWSVTAESGVQRLTRTFAFQDFKSALAFTDQVGALAEAHNHHPEILTAWGKVTVAWWTYTVRGLHLNDFILAARTGRIYKG